MNVSMFLMLLLVRATYHSVFLEINTQSEELGQKRPDNDRITPVHYSEICKSELRRSDRRAAMCVEQGSK